MGWYRLTPARTGTDSEVERVSGEGRIVLGRHGRVRSPTAPVRAASKEVNELEQKRTLMPFPGLTHSCASVRRVAKPARRGPISGGGCAPLNRLLRQAVTQNEVILMVELLRSQLPVPYKF